MQEFAVTFSRFLKAYSVIVKVVQVADSQFGHVALATLSVLFAVRDLNQASFFVVFCSCPLFLGFIPTFTLSLPLISFLRAPFSCYPSFSLSLCFTGFFIIALPKKRGSFA